MQGWFTHWTPIVPDGFIRMERYHPDPNGDIEGRILEDSARVMIAETVAGEYVAVQKAHIQSIQKEPVADFIIAAGRFMNKKAVKALPCWIISKH